jgi:predicted phage terminase large subunit-like protein
VTVTVRKKDGQQTADPLAIAERQIQAAQRLLRLKKARDSLLDFTFMSMPDPDDIDNPEASRYKVRPHHRFIANALEDVISGNTPWLILSVPPRMGKSELVSRRLPAWFLGRDPYANVIVTSYGEELALDFGREVREIMLSPFYQQVFTGTHLRKGSRSAERLQTVEGGMGVFTGIGGTITGRGADCLIIDDPIKDRVSANSRTIRNQQWDWFRDVAMSRLMGAGRMVICMTRWHEDDIVGRITNPRNPHYDPQFAAEWKVVNIPAFAEVNDPVGRQPGEILWPERSPLKFLENQRRINPSGFSALYMGRPAPPEGDFFKGDHLRTYNSMGALPKNLRMYAASDHAVSTEDSANPSCMGVVGVDEEDNIWVLPDLVWRRMDSETQVESMLALIREHRPLFWWAEKGHISKSIGPFLRKRMLEEGVYGTIIEKTPVKDKQTRAQSIQARMSMGKVFFPSFAPWWADAKDQLLNFPFSQEDDFVDFLAWIGIGLGEQVPAGRRAPKVRPVQTGTIQWILDSSRRIREQNSSENRYLS